MQKRVLPALGVPDDGVDPMDHDSAERMRDKVIWLLRQLAVSILILGAVVMALRFAQLLV